jgi:hypothetical protein
MQSRPFPRRKPSRHEPASTEREPKPLAKVTRWGTAGATSGVAVPKDAPVRHEGYRYLVAQLPCKHCGIYGYSQAAHPNTGKGQGTKTDDRLCFPLCTVHPVLGGFVSGCHEQFDQGALFAKAVRREIEPAWGADTRATIAAMGLWPADLAMLEGA